MFRRNKCERFQKIVLWVLAIWSSYLNKQETKIFDLNSDIFYFDEFVKYN